MEMDIFDSLNIESGDQDSLTGFVDSVQEFLSNSPKPTEEDQIYNVIGIDKLFESASNNIDDSYDFSDIQDIKDFSIASSTGCVPLQDEVHFIDDNTAIQGLSHCQDNSVNGNNFCGSQPISQQICSTRVKREIVTESSMPPCRELKKIKIDKECCESKRNSSIPACSQKDFKAITGKNPRSGYLIFCSDVRKSIAEKNPGVSFSDIGKAMGVEWNNLSENQKQVYQDRAKIINLQKLNESRDRSQDNESGFSPPILTFNRAEKMVEHSNCPVPVLPVCSSQNQIILSVPKCSIISSNSTIVSADSTTDCIKYTSNFSKSSPFDIFCNEMRQKILTRHPKARSKNSEELFQLLKSEWNSLSEKDRFPYESKAKQNICNSVPNTADDHSFRSTKGNGPGFRNFKAITGQNQKTGYLMFCSEVRKGITEKNPGVSFSDLGKAMGIEWNRLSEKQKQVYQDKAKEINNQILLETKDRPKDDMQPIAKSKTKSKPSKSGFSVFATEYRKEMKKKFPNYNRREISQLVSNEWKKLGADEKLRYVHQAAAVNLVIESEKASICPPNNSVEMDLNVSCQSINSEQSNSMNLFCGSYTPSSKSETKKGKKKSPSITENGSRKGRSNGYQLYCVERHKKVKEDMPDATFGEICRFVGNEWKALSANIRKEYQDKANLINLESQAKKEHKLNTPIGEKEKIFKTSWPKQSVSTPVNKPTNDVKPTKSNNSVTLPEMPAPVLKQPQMYRHIVPNSQTIMKTQDVQVPFQMPNTQLVYFIPQKWNSVQAISQVNSQSIADPIIQNVSILQKPVDTELPNETFISKEKFMSYKIYNPLSAYQYFFVEMQRKVNAKYPSLSFDKVSQLIDTQWFHLSDKGRKLLQSRVDQIKREIEKAKHLYMNDYETQESLSHVESDDDSLENPESPPAVTINEELGNFTDEFDSLEAYFDELQSPENPRSFHHSDFDNIMTPESINNTNPNDTSVVSGNLNLSDFFETPKAIKLESESMDMLDLIDTSLPSSQRESTELSSNLELPVSFENFKAVVERQNGSMFEATYKFHGTVLKKKKTSIPKSCPQVAYQIFFKEMEKSLTVKNPQASIDDISKLIDVQWKRLKKSDKKVLKMQARRSLNLAKEQQQCISTDPSAIDIKKCVIPLIKSETENCKSSSSPHLQALLSSTVKSEVFDPEYNPNVIDKSLNKNMFSAKKFESSNLLGSLPTNTVMPLLNSPKDKKFVKKANKEDKYEIKPLQENKVVGKSLAELNSNVKLENSSLQIIKQELAGCDSLLASNCLTDFKPKAKFLYDTLMNFEEDGRKPITLFILLPSKEKWPDYYKIVKHPMDMKTFEEKLKNDRYRDIKGVIRDLRLMFRNCLEFHKKGSQIYKDSIMLKQILNKAIRECKPELELPIHKEDDGESEDTSNFFNLRKIKIFFYSIRNVKEKNKALTRFFWKPLNNDLNPRYFEVIKEPIDLDIISQKISSNVYNSLSDIYCDFKKLFFNAYRYYEPQSQIYRAALGLHRFAMQKYAELNREDDVIPNLHNSIQELLLAIFVSMFNHKNCNGRYLSDAIAGLPAFERINGVWTRVETLESIRMRLSDGQYVRLDEFQNDLFCVFERARRFNETTDLYDDSVKLQRKYITARDQLSAHGMNLKSPALNFKLKDFTCELHDEKRELPLSNDDQTQLSSCGDIHCSFKNAKGDIFSVGDFIYINPQESENISDCLIMEIDKLWTDSMGRELVYGLQYFKPQDTNMWLGNVPEETVIDEKAAHGYYSLKFHHQELVKSEIYLNLSFSKVVGKCVIISHDDYCRLLVENFHSQDVYCCHYLYSFSSHTFENLDLINYQSLKVPKYASTLVRTEPLQVGLLRSLFEIKLEKREKEFTDLQEYTEKYTSSLNMQNIVKKEEEIEDGTYYIQYRSPVGYLKMGDFVYIRPENASEKFILHINRIVVTANWEESIIGTKYIIQDRILDNQEEVSSFYKEAYYLVNKETYPLSHVIGRCMILNFKDYLTLRSTHIPEEDVYLCEYSIDMADRCLRPQEYAITKYKLPSEVLQDEIYCWPNTINIKEIKRNHFINGEHFDVKYPIDDDKFSKTNNLDPAPKFKESSTPKFKINNYYFFFQNERLKELKKLHPESSPSELYSVTAQEWKGLSDEIKMDYQRRMREQQAALSAEQSNETSVEEYYEADERKSYRHVRCKILEKKNEPIFRRRWSHHSEEVDLCQTTLFNWLKLQKKLEKVVTCKEFKEKACSLYRDTSLSPPYYGLLRHFKEIYRSEIHNEQLIKDGRGRPPVEVDNKIKKRRRVKKRIREAKLSIQREADLQLLEEFDIRDCRVVVKSVELYELSNRDRIYLQRRCHDLLKRFSFRRCGRKVVSRKKFKCMKRLKLEGPKINHCKMCDLEFSNKENFYRHLKYQHKESVGSNTCDLCGKCFQKIRDLSCHKRWHMMMQKHWFYCKVCDKYLKNEKLMQHKQQHAYENIKLELNEFRQLQVVTLTDIRMSFPNMPNNQNSEENSLSLSKLENLSSDTYMETLQDDLNDSLLENFEELTEHLDADILSTNSPLNMLPDDVTIINQTNNESKIVKLVPNIVSKISDSSAMEFDTDYAKLDISAVEIDGRTIPDSLETTFKEPDTSPVESGELTLKQGINIVDTIPNVENETPNSKPNFRSHNNLESNGNRNEESSSTSVDQNGPSVVSNLCRKSTESEFLFNSFEHNLGKFS